MLYPVSFESIIQYSLNSLILASFNIVLIEYNQIFNLYKNVELITISLTGKTAPDILADFEFNEEGTKVIRCHAGHAPKSCSYMKQSNQCAVSFLHGQCANCPY